MRSSACSVLPGVLICLPLICVAQPDQSQYLGSSRPTTTPQRVVSLAPNLTEILFAIGAGQRLVGVTRFDDYPPAVKELPSVGGFIDPSLEQILSLRPDLIVCVPNSGNKQKMIALSKMGVSVLVLPARSIQDVYAAVKTLGDLLDREAPSRKLLKKMKSRVREVATRVKGLPVPRVLLVYGHNPLVVAGKDSWGDRLIGLAGGRNVMADSRVPYPSVPMEQLLNLKPDVILDASSSGTGAEMANSELQTGWQRWRVMPAVRNGRVHLFDSALWFRPGPRLVDGLEHLADLLHPKPKQAP